MSESGLKVNLADQVKAERTSSMGRSNTKHRGVLFRPNPKGTTHRNGTKRGVVGQLCLRVRPSASRKDRAPRCGEADSQPPS